MRYFLSSLSKGLEFMRQLKRAKVQFIKLSNHADRYIRLCHTNQFGIKSTELQAFYSVSTLLCQSIKDYLLQTLDCPQTSLNLFNFEFLNHKIYFLFHFLAQYFACYVAHTNLMC
jgi:hypothetical protein